MNYIGVSSNFNYLDMRIIVIRELDSRYIGAKRLMTNARFWKRVTNLGAQRVFQKREVKSEVCGWEIKSVDGPEDRNQTISL
jgi:hypothetical protein